jgi:hypothetical protein
MQYAKHHWEIGDYIPGLQGQGFTATHWFLPEELRVLFEKQKYWKWQVWKDSLRIMKKKLIDFIKIKKSGKFGWRLC